LNLGANGKSIALGVNSNGALTIDSLSLNSGLTANGNAAIGGNLSVLGTGGVTSSALSAPIPSGSTTAGALALTGSTITLNGNVDPERKHDAVPGQRPHPLVSGAEWQHMSLRQATPDVAGTISVTPPASASPALSTVQVNFTKPYTTAPIVVVTAASNPLQGSQIPAVWVTSNLNGSTGQYSGFTLHYQVASTGASVAAVTYNYHVIGS